MQRILPTLSFPKTAFQLLHSLLELLYLLHQLFFLGIAVLPCLVDPLLILHRTFIPELLETLQKRVAVLHSGVQEA